MSDEKTCGTCVHFTPTYVQVEVQYGTCDYPVPYYINRFFSNRYVPESEPGCPCWWSAEKIGGTSSEED